MNQTNVLVSLSTKREFRHAVPGVLEGVFVEVSTANPRVLIHGEAGTILVQKLNWAKFKELINAVEV